MQTVLEHHSERIGESKAAKEFFKRRQKWAAKIPEPDALWAWLQTLDRKAREKLMALCVAMTVNALHGSERDADPLAELVGLDMRSWWKSSDGLLARLSKAGILAAVTQCVSPEAARRLSGLKKPAMAGQAAQMLPESGWLPECLRAPHTLAAESLQEPTAKPVLFIRPPAISSDLGGAPVIWDFFVV